MYSGHLAGAIEPVKAGEQRLGAVKRQNHGHAGPDTVAFDERAVAHAHSPDVRDSVVTARSAVSDHNAQISRAHPALFGHEPHAVAARFIEPAPSATSSSHDTS